MTTRKATRTTEDCASQTNDYPSFWIDVRTASYQNSVAHAGDPEVVIANGSVGASLVLFYIRKPASPLCRGGR